MTSTARQNFRVDLGGVIALLSTNLYSGPGVYVRELLQNALDAIVARDALGGERAPRAISISPYGVASPGSPADEFMIADAGIGLTAPQVEQFLATVGSSSKRDELAGGRRTYIGQFGIGLLSCFLVADEITVVSRSATGAEPIRWVGASDGTYTVGAAAGDVAVGTTVRLRPRPAMIGWVRVEQLVPLVRKYAEFLPAKVAVLTGDGPIGVSHAYPWDQDFGAHRAAVMQGVAPLYGGVGLGRQFDVVEVADAELGLRGVIYLGASNRPGGLDGSRVYINDMLIDGATGDVLPPWAFFARAVINSTALEPTASRESVMSSPALTKTRRVLGHAVLDWLRRLADTDPQRFAQFVADHELELRSAATCGTAGENVELAEVVLPMLTVQTTDGDMRLIDVIEANPNILYAASVTEFRTIASFNPGGRIVVNAGHTLDQEVLLTVAQVCPGVTATRAYPAAEVAALMLPAPDAREPAQLLARRASAALTESHCRVAVRRFPTIEPTAVFIGRGRIDPASPGDEDLRSLVLNWDNRAVQALTRTTDAPVFARLVQLLFVQARIAGQFDGPADRTLLSEALDDLILLAAGVDGTAVIR